MVAGEVLLDCLGGNLNPFNPPCCRFSSPTLHPTGQGPRVISQTN